MKHHHYIVSFLSLFILGLLGFYAINSQSPEELKAGTSDNVDGWAWSSVSGWISFNCTNTGSCAQSNYGVRVDPITGAFSGYSWSSHAGWISFNPTDLVGCPATSTPCEARVVDGLDGDFPKEVTGWAKVLSTDSWLSLRAPLSGWVSDGDTWASKPNLPSTRKDAAIVSANGKIYVIGGVTGGGFGCMAIGCSVPSPTYHTRVDEYDPATNTWTQKASMPTGRSQLIAIALNNKIYAVGGYNASGYLAVNEEYDPVANSWVSKASMPTPRSYAGGGAANSRVFVIGGYNSGGTLSVNEEYNPSNNTWISRASLPAARYSPASGVVGGKIYIIGGSSTNTNYEYSPPPANSWSTKAVIPTTRLYYTPASGAADGKVYVIGGYNTAKNEEYDPTTNSWTVRADWPRGSAWESIGGAEAGGKIYVVYSSVGYNDEYQPLTQFFYHPYGVELDENGNFSGYAWEDQVLGWVRWSSPNVPPDYAVHVPVGPPVPPEPPPLAPTTTPGGIRETRP